MQTEGANERFETGELILCVAAFFAKKKALLSNSLVTTAVPKSALYGARVRLCVCFGKVQACCVCHDGCAGSFLFRL